MEKEKVLVLPEKLIENWDFSKNNGLFLGDSKDDLRQKVDFILESTELFYKNRDEAEKDESVKQLIPYCLLVKNDKIFCYQRTNKGGEKRLHNLWSLGVGGHINPCDGEGKNSYHIAMSRELQEEVDFKMDVSKGVNESFIKNEVVGFIYDNSNEVGRVHLGVCHIITIPDEIILKFNDKGLETGEFNTIKCIKNSKDMFEGWSKIIIDNLLTDDINS